ncbi:MAG: FKBP-type peptidyl-prolyl cis-trans isomerase [Candidatus Micrarchaeia archaeon]
MALKDGDFVEIEYNAWNAVDNSLILSTDKEKAKEAGIYDEKSRYGPVLFVLGSKGNIKGLDRELHNINVGETKKFTLKPEDAFGERDESLMRVMPLSEFRKRDINPYPGMNIDIDNIPAIVKSVNSGRVVVDANHPFAGREIIYEVKVVKLLASDDEKVKALAETYNLNVSKIEYSDDKVKLSFGNDVGKDANYFVNKATLVASIFNYFDKVNKVYVEEEYARDKKKEQNEESKEK